MGFFTKKHAQQTIEVGGVTIISDYAGDPLDGWRRALTYHRQGAFDQLMITAPTPNEFFLALQRDLPETLKVTVHICKEANGFVTQIIGGASEAEHLYSAQISVAPGHYATLSHADAAPKFFGKGIMKSFFDSFVHNYLLPLTNVSTMNVGAKNPYTWIFYGFLPESREWQQKIAPAISSQFELVKDRLTSGVAHEIDGLLRSPDPASLRVIAEHRDVLVNHQPLPHFLLSHVGQWTGHLQIRDEADLAYFDRHVKQCQRPDGLPKQDIAAGAMLRLDAKGRPVFV